MKVSKRAVSLLLSALMISSFVACSNTSAKAADKSMNEIKEELRAQYGENKRITETVLSLAKGMRVSLPTRVFRLSANSL